ncbi:hypothetical protein AAYR83_002720 [Salmonella enterica]|nr:hypothetical protein [Salmonella enterica]ECJ7675373.1 hypothetical protein [Salmonella enterica]EDZ3576754.1 hypothetical protein [Salmonella enterica]
MMQQLIADIMPQVEVMHLVEESMIKQVMKAGGVTPNIAARIADYIHIAEKASCDIFITACSSIGSAVVKRKVGESGKQRTITPVLMEDAFHALLAGDTAIHDRIVSEGLQNAFTQADVIMLAQASMARVLQQLPTPPIPVMTSPDGDAETSYQAYEITQA